MLQQIGRVGTLKLVPRTCLRYFQTTMTIGGGELGKSEGRLHFLILKKQQKIVQKSAFLREITSRNNDDFCCLNYIHSFRTKNKLDPHKRACENKNFCNVNMPPDDNPNTLEFNQCQKSDKAPFFMQISIV